MESFYICKDFNEGGTLDEKYVFCGLARGGNKSKTIEVCVGNI